MEERIKQLNKQLDELLLWKQQQFHIPLSQNTLGIIQQDLPVVTGKVGDGTTTTYDKAIEIDFSGMTLWLLATTS